MGELLAVSISIIPFHFTWLAALVTPLALDTVNNNIYFDALNPLAEKRKLRLIGKKMRDRVKMCVCVNMTKHARG